MLLAINHQPSTLNLPMPDPFRKWAQGDEWSPSAAQLNAWTDAARLAAQAQRGVPLDIPTGPPCYVPLRICNTTGERIPELGVISFAAPMVTPTVSSDRFIAIPTLTAIKPTAPLDRFAICHRSLAVDEVADNVAMLLGVVPCRITGTGTHAQATANNMTRLQAGTTGHPIIFQEAGSSERYALVQLGGSSQQCRKRYQLFALNQPSAGSIILLVRAKNGSGVWVEENKTIPYGSTQAAIKAVLETHSEITLPVTVSGPSSLTSSPVTIEMPPDSEIGNGVVAIVSHSLTNSLLVSPTAYLSECC
jgi:hypothetical protein